MGIYSLKKVYDVLNSTNFYTDNERYLLIKLDKKNYSRIMNKLSNYNNIYSEIINDKDELSIIIPKNIWEQDL